MFSGIIEQTGRVLRRDRRGEILELTVETREWVRELKQGQSVSVNGVCLTIAGLRKNGFKVQVVPETLKSTNLGDLKEGDAVNLERSLKLSERLDGHFVLGHVDGVGKITKLIQENGNVMLQIHAPGALMRHLVNKGSVALDGVSLTVQDVGEDSFKVALIPFTIERTNLGKKREGDLVNLEADILSKYVQKQIAGSDSKLTVEFLKEQGF
jgi:riboflavin synthase